MGNPKGFLEYARKSNEERNPKERINDWNEYTLRQTDQDLKQQGERCMDCGTPFCHTGMEWDKSSIGCPINNLIPEWNEFVHQGKWKQALERLELTNNFPEFTGRVCPAPCEGSCVLGINDDPVTIKSIENEIVERGFDNGWIQPVPPKTRTGKHIAIIGSGPAGLTAADELNKAGHYVTVFEREDRPGGLLMYGIPNMKLEKKTIDRRIQILMEEGIQFQLNTEIGVDISKDQLLSDYDAVVLCTGAQQPRDIPIEERESKGIHFAMDYLTESTKSLHSKSEPNISAEGKDVIVIGGGDTGADCVATALRQKCKSIVQFGKHPELPLNRGEDNPWPHTPMTFSLEYAYEEAHKQYKKDPREYEVLTQAFKSSDNGSVQSLITSQVKKETKDGKTITVNIPNTEKEWNAQLVLIAIGFTGPEQEILEHFDLRKTERGLVWTDQSTYKTSVDGVFTAGDARRGQSLVVWAIREGREVAKEVNEYVLNSQNTALTS
ncbi:glutamate synthase subunit beta [Pseudalkalibacillus berkeleyi]|uniref:Glutamate synthase subunit beta n=1 Tax=Pseudalkalibacillus berkeleyi TaxID=1069813 RepID=A0ABS9H0Q2_9BACL|nr:glutamate synthase subunit beta [Pseudalkalibacillus berkeleyi]MCF6137348.1 glutamate synthase subunit beta [Pseudalkalibacillus berkeleyi]